MTMDLFSRARLKITLLYFLLGLVILAVAGYFVYRDITAIVQHLLTFIQQILAGQIAADQHTVATLMAQAIRSQIAQMDIAVGIWLIVAMVLAAYILAGITLQPMRRTMERQKRFMANVSHELRTPLSVMRANSEATLLGAATATREELTEAITSNVEELDRMAKILEFLLNFSNIENRLKRLTFSTVDLVEIAKKAVGLTRRMAAEKNITVAIEGPSTASISGNATAIEEMIVNLLKNAIAYTPEGGLVKVGIAKRFGAATLSVADTGVGIPKKDLPKIFEAFYRGDNVVKVKKDGSVGLGLAIVKEIAAFHGATIRPESEVGKGTTINIHFPTRISWWFGGIAAS